MAKKPVRFQGLGDPSSSAEHGFLLRLLCALAVSQAQTTAPGIEKLKQSNQALATGRRTFESTCAPCHGLNGKGGERAPDIATQP